MDLEKLEEKKSEEKKVETKPKNVSFIGKLKARIHELVESENLTTAGRVYLMAGYVSFITFIIIMVLSALQTTKNILFAIYNIQIKLGHLFVGATVISSITFAVSFIFVIIVSAVECAVASDKESILLDNAD